MNWKREFVNILWKSDEISLTEIDQAFLLKEANIPEKIYKFSSLDNIKNVLENIEKNKIYLNKPKNFNDPYDSYTRINRTVLIDAIKRKNAMHEISKNKIHLMYDSSNRLDYSPITPAPNKLLRDISERRHDEILEKFRDLTSISCFSESNESVLMWAHYANNHTGICIEYTISTLRSDSILRRSLYPIIYSSLLVDMTPLILSQLHKRPFNNLMPLKSCAYKNKDWEYEREWRLIILGYNKNNVATPTPTKIFLGARIGLKEEESIRNLCQRRSIEVVKMSHSKYKHKMAPTIAIL